MVWGNGDSYTWTTINFFLKDSIRNGEAKELVCMAHGHEIRGGMLVGCRVEGNKGEIKNGTTLIA